MGRSLSEAEKRRRRVIARREDLSRPEQAALVRDGGRFRMGARSWSHECFKYGAQARGRWPGPSAGNARFRDRRLTTFGLRYRVMDDHHNGLKVTLGAAVVRALGLKVDDYVVVTYDVTDRSVKVRRE